MKSVLILGMHRSGTSSVTKALSFMGVELGTNLLGAQKENSKGFWEDRFIVALNTELMKMSEQDWHTFGLIDPNNGKCLENKAVEYLKQQFSKSPVWGFKDPRATRLLPFWNGVLSSIGADVVYCVVIRHPLSVINSLEKRNSFSSRRAALLWYVYYMDLLISLRGRSFTVIDYDSLMDNPRNEFIRMADGVGQSGLLSEDKIAEYCDEFLSSDMRHSKFELKSLTLNKHIPEEVSQLYIDLLELTKKTNTNIPSFLNDRLDEWQKNRNFFNSFFELINGLGESEERLNIAITHVENSLKERDHAIKERDIMENRHQMAVKSLEESQIKFESLKNSKIRIENELDSIYRSYSWKFTSPLRHIINILKR